jgi:hypothetical protein
MAWALGGTAQAQTSPPSQLQSLDAAIFDRTAAENDPIAALLDRGTIARDGLVRWGAAETPVTGAAGVFDTLKLRLGQTFVSPGGLPLAHERTGAETTSYEVMAVRHWPGAMSFKGVDVSPHAGLGLADGHTSAEAGVQVSQKVGQALQALGVRDGATFGDRGRWYLFAAASGRSVGLNMLRQGGSWERAGFSTDQQSALVGDTQVGVGWRQGQTQTSLGFVHREIKSSHMLYGVDPKAEDLVALSFSIRPH